MDVASFAPVAIVGAAALSFAVIALFQWLWNITLPELFRWPALTYWQSMRIVVIASILFKS